MSQEVFKPLRTWDTALKAYRTMQVVSCSNCDTFENVPVHSGSALPPEVIVKKMQQRGWVMGNRRAYDLCPKCAEAKTNAKGHIKLVAEAKGDKMKTLTDVQNAMEGATLNLPGAGTTKAVDVAISREEKRAILDELELGYNPTKQSYATGYTDASIGKKLNVPVSLVAKLRDEFFGPAENPEMLKLLSRLDLAQQRLDDMKKDANKLLENLTLVDQEITVLQGKIKELR